MAEDLLGGVLGGEDEQISEAASVAGAEAFAAAVAARLSGNDPGVARKTEIFLEKQAQLLDTQHRHLEDEHALRLAQLRGQRVAQALRIGFQVAIALLVIVIAASIAVMLRDAFTSHSVVIDSFDSPAALTARGATGAVLASGILDELTRLQSATATRTLDRRGDWAGAQQAYAQAVAIAPDLPQPYYYWGAALAHHGDLAGALVQLRAANQRGPHWADPLKAWGDVLARQGHWSEALARYDEALKYAPNWAALQQARDAARSPHHV